ncbi:MAG: M15 family metallopeptidase [Candidatus Woykebacteria bacterium]
MKLKLALFSLFLFVAIGAIFAFVNLYYLAPPDPKIEQSVVLASQDLPVDSSVLTAEDSSPPKETKASKPLVLKEKVSVAGQSVYTPPKPAIKTTNKGDNLLVLINKTIRLPSTYVPVGLVVLDNSIKLGYPGMQLRKEAADALLKMIKDGNKKGYDYMVNSAYRSYQTQVTTYNYWVSQVGVAEADRFSARPGFSQHQLGTALDITSSSVNYKLMAAYGNTAEGKWLAQNAYKYGFVLSYPAGYENITGYTYEPWHFRYIGVGNAKKMKDSGLILEKFLQKYGVW